MLEGMHLTLIGKDTVLLEPGEGLDASAHDSYLVPLLTYLQKNKARRLLYDLKNIRVIDSVYYRWLLAVSALCRIANIEMISVNMRPAVAYALAMMLTEAPPFSCALDVSSVRDRR